ncbi:hypothetical protein [Aureivirga marina]|uniref:hypothetical protein n=1 Tax=Aureivirga marina TaxID=1182451 RepID=UPI0018CAF657|nr:hypothetical protein [Aureivirga marina]
MEEFWADYLYKEQVFSYDIEIPINYLNYKTQILNFDVSFLRLGFKYGIYIYSHNIEDLEEDLQQYKNERLERFFNPDIEYHFLNLIDLVQWDKFNQQRLDNADLLEYSQLFYEEKLIKINASGYNMKPSIFRTMSCIHDEFKDLKNDWNTTCFINIYSYSPIWLSEVDLSEIIFKKSERIVPNPLGNEFTLKFNSFLRDLKKVVESLGGTIIFDEQCYQVYADEEGIKL